MEYSFKPSLRHRALVTIASTMWTKHNILSSAMFRAPRYSELQNKWNVIEESVLRKAYRLPLVEEECIENLLEIIRATGLRILAWVSLQKHYRFSVELPNKFCWTPQGTVDLKNTAKLMLLGNSEELDIDQRFRIACTYCSVNEINSLWEKFGGDREFSLEDLTEGEEPIVAFWIYNQVRREVLGKNSPEKKSTANINEAAFRHATKNGNEAATRYFLQNLTLQETEVIQCVQTLAKRIRANGLRWMTYHVHYNDVLYLLLSTMTSQQRTQVIRDYLCEILICFIEYPWRGVFVEMSKREWANLSEVKYKDVLFHIALKLHWKRTECDCEDLFEAFWLMSSQSYKNYVLDNCVELLAIRHPPNSKKQVVLHNDIERFEEESIIFPYLAQEICEKLAHSRKWDLLHCFIEYDLLSKGFAIILKKEIALFVYNTLIKKTDIDDYHRLLDIVREDEYVDYSEISDEFDEDDQEPEDTSDE